MSAVQTDTVSTGIYLTAHNDLQHLEKELDFCLIENEALRLATFIAS